MKTQTRSDMLAKDRTGPLLIKLSLPAILGMLVHAVFMKKV